jgi:flagellar protein FlbD
MILLTGLNNREFYLNCDLIERIDVTPDTVISTTNNKKFVVKESPDVIIQRIIDFRARYMVNKPEVNRDEQA